MSVKKMCKPARKTQFQKVEVAAKSCGPPPCEGFPPEPVTTHDFDTLRDLRIAFGMMDTQQEGELGLENAKTVFRCLGWCVSEQELELALDKVDTKEPVMVGLGTSLLPGFKRKGKKRGPWNMQQLEQACDWLKERTRKNGSIEKLAMAVAYLSNQPRDLGDRSFNYRVQTLSFNDLSKMMCTNSKSQFGLGYSTEDFEMITNAMHIDRDMIDMNVKMMAVTMVDRIMQPQSILDGM
jgi:hypothetical protein